MKIFSVFAIAFLCLSSLQAQCWPDSNENTLKVGEKIIFVSLGMGCVPAIALRDANLRTTAFPFDWNFSQHLDKLVTLLDEDFQFFFTRGPSHKSYCGKAANLYSIEFCHDDPPPFSDMPGSESVIAKYQRRIERFRNLRTFPGKVIFLRQPHDDLCWPNPEIGKKIGKIDDLEARELRDALRRYFPNLDFLLVIFNYHHTQLPPIIDVENTIEFKITDYKSENLINALHELIP